MRAARRQADDLSGMFVAPLTVDLSRGDSRLLCDLRSVERLVAAPGGPGTGRLERALGAELTGKLLFALARSRDCAPAGEAAA